MRALVTSVVPCTSVPRALRAMAPASTRGRRPTSTASLGSAGVLNVLPITVPPSAPSSSRSVKVPPMSTPTR